MNVQMYKVDKFLNVFFLFYEFDIQWDDLAWKYQLTLFNPICGGVENIRGGAFSAPPILS